MSRILLISFFFIASLVVCTFAQDSLCTGQNEEYYQCGACDSTCESNISCITVCRGGECGCKSGYVRNDQNKCIRKENCSSYVSRLGK